MERMKTTVMKRGAAQFNQVGQFLGYPLKDLDEQISVGLTKRLVQYAERRLTDAGFSFLSKDWKIEAYTMDGDEAPADRSYCVRFENESGGHIEVTGILTKRGWPVLDHGFSIGQD